MTFNELVESILEILPNATFGEDNDGQIVIYTDLIENPDITDLIQFSDEE